MLFDNLTHTQRKFVMTFPFVPHDDNRVVLGVSVDDVDLYWMLLLEPLNTKNGLDEIVEFVSRPNKDSFVTVPLKVAS
jgi:hypothetical protein